MEFKAIPRTISDALTLKRKYVIPRFQREYSWESDELTELWDDLLDSIKLDGDKLTATEYFIGSLVLVGDDDNTTNIERQVVDGQQRLMTFTIAFSVLSQLFKKENEGKLSEIVHGYIVAEDENGDAYTKVVSETPKPFFQYRIQQKDIDFKQIPNSSEEKRILFAYRFFEEKLSAKALTKSFSARFPNVEISYVELLKLIRDQILKCKVIYVTVNSFDDAYTIFEVLNAKGKDLTPVDIIKNSLFSILQQTEPIDAAYEKWNIIRGNMTAAKTDDIVTFYRHYWLSKYGLVTNKNLVRHFNERIEKTETAYSQFLDDLKEASIDYAEIATPNPSKWRQPEDREVFETLEAINTFGVTQVRSFLIALFDAKRKDLISHSEYLKILAYLQYFHFVFNAICSERPSGMERRYSSYARKLRECTTKKESSLCIRELISALAETLPAYEVFESHFLNVEYTSDNSKQKRLVQYILKRIEDYSSGTAEMKPDSFSIEHILPESTRHQMVGCLGNLLPLGADLNSELDNKNFTDKIAGYRRSQYKTVQEFVARYEKVPVWSEDEITARTKRLAYIMYNCGKLPTELEKA